MPIVKSSEPKARTGQILDKAKRSPVYVERDVMLLVITKARLVPAQANVILSPWEIRAEAIESFYDPAKAW